ncbi:MAG: hypothetical protein ACE5IE_06400 [Dehalococcoidia bacterium]
MRLSRVERETIIAFNEDEDIAYIYTCNRRWMRQLEKYGFKASREHADKGQVYAKEFEVPKELIRMPRPPTRKELAQRGVQAERLRKYRFSRKIPAGPSAKVEATTTT